jgi:hypothetical protein
MQALDDQTAELSSDWLLWAAVFSLLASGSLFVWKHNAHRPFLGRWPPTPRLFGLYNRVVTFIAEGARPSMPRVAEGTSSVRRFVQDRWRWRS